MTDTATQYTRDHAEDAALNGVLPDGTAARTSFAFIFGTEISSVTLEEFKKRWIAAQYNQVDDEEGQLVCVAAPDSPVLQPVRVAVPSCYTDQEDWIYYLVALETEDGRLLAAFHARIDGRA